MHILVDMVSLCQPLVGHGMSWEREMLTEAIRYDSTRNKG